VARNIEIKAHVERVYALEHAVAALAPQGPVEIAQNDSVPLKDLSILTNLAIIQRVDEERRRSQRLRYERPAWEGAASGGRGSTASGRRREGRAD
jgi:hypothetical protein